MPDPTIAEFVKSVVNIPIVLGDILREIRSIRAEVTGVQTQNPGTRKMAQTTQSGTNFSGKHSKNLAFHHKGISKESMRKHSTLLLQGLLDTPMYDKTGIGRSGVESLILAEGKKDLIRRVINPLVSLGVLIRIGNNFKLPNDRTIVRNYLNMVNETTVVGGLA